MLKFLALAVIGLAVAGTVFVRLAPVDGAQWNVDPLTAAQPGAKGWLVRPEGGDAAWQEFDTQSEILLAAFDRIVMDEPRTARVEGDVAAGRITYVTRSRLWGFPDFTTVAAVPYGEGTTLAVLARARFGQSDLRVNRDRVNRWYGALRQSLASTEPAAE